MSITSIVSVISCSNTNETVDGYTTYYENAIKTYIFGKMRKHLDVDKQIFDKVQEQMDLGMQIYEKDNQKYNLFGLFLDKNIEDTNRYLKKFDSKWLPSTFSTSNFSISSLKLKTNNDNTTKNFKFVASLTICSFDEKGIIKESKDIKFESNEFEISVK